MYTTPRSQREGMGKAVECRRCKGNTGGVDANGASTWRQSRDPWKLSILALNPQTRFCIHEFRGFESKPRRKEVFLRKGNMAGERRK